MQIRITKLSKTEEIIIVESNLGELVKEAVEKSCSDIKAFYIVESFIKNNDIINQIMCVSPFMGDNDQQLYLIAEFSSNDFSQISDRRDMRKQDYYNFITTENTLSVDTKIRVQFKYYSSELSIESIDNFAAMRIKYDTDNFQSSKNLLKNFKTVKFIDYADEKSMEEVFYRRSLSVDRGVR